jgi:hypothetical protein
MRSKSAAEFSSAGWPSNSGWWHLPQLGFSPASSRDCAARLTVPQCGQTMVSATSVSAVTFS